MKQTLTDKNLRRLILQTKPYTLKRLYYSSIFLATAGICLKCNTCHAGKCNRK